MKMTTSAEFVSNIWQNLGHCFSWRGKIVFPKLSDLCQGKAMLLKTLLNNVVRFKSFVYDSISVMLVEVVEASVIDIKPRIDSQPICLGCGKRRTGYEL